MPGAKFHLPFDTFGCQISTPSSSLHELKRSGTFLGLKWHPLFTASNYMQCCHFVYVLCICTAHCASLNSCSVRYNVVCYFGIHTVKSLLLSVFTGKCCLQWCVFRAECNVQFTLKCEDLQFVLCFVLLHGVQCTVCIVLDITEGAGSDISRVSRQTALTAGTPLELQCTAVNLCVL